ncbi:MAG: hypothetical protein ACUVV6_00155 [Thermoplasmatota archaeon]
MGERRILVLAVAMLLVAIGLFAYLVVTPPGGPGGEGEAPGPVRLPLWVKGQYWLYSFRTPEVEYTTARVVVADMDARNYQLGISTLLDAQRHAVLNYNPMLGRVGRDNLSIYEKGEPKSVLTFPLTQGKRWTFSLLGVEGFEARVADMQRTRFPDAGDTVLVKITASASSGDSLNYSYDSSAGWLRSFEWRGPSGEENLVMTLLHAGAGYTGQAYFVRGVDLYAKELSSSRGAPDVELYDSFVDRGHPTWGPFDTLIYYYRATTGSRSNIAVTITAHTGATVRALRVDSEEHQSGLGTMESSAGEWGVALLLQGDCCLRLLIAGGITYTWSV